MTGCGGPADPATGCDPAAVRIDWSPRTFEPVLTGAWDDAGRTVVDRSFRASAGGRVPAAWVPALEASLRRMARPSSAAPAASGGQIIGVPSAPGAVTIRYTGVDRVTADFVAHCTPEVRGTFVGATSLGSGVVVCGDSPGGQDAYTVLALEHCP
jgi:hypothetical protein